MSVTEVRYAQVTPIGKLQKFQNADYNLTSESCALEIESTSSELPDLVARQQTCFARSFVSSVFHFSEDKAFATFPHRINFVEKSPILFAKT